MKWYVIQTHSKQEYRSLDHLEQQNYMVYLPQKPIDLRYKRRNKRKTEPLFPGYLFIRLSKEKDDWGPIRSTRGIVGIVKFGQAIPHVDDVFINDFMKFEHACKTDYEIGDKVLFNSASFLNIPAIVKCSESERIQVLMKIMSKEQLVDVKREQISPE